MPICFFFQVLFLAFLFYSSPLSAQVPENDLLQQIAPPLDIPMGDVPLESKGDLEAPFKIQVDGKVTLNYVFADSPDSFIVTYKVHMEGTVRNKVDVVRGKGKVSSEVKGFLAKWPTGECTLKVGIGEFPYEMVFTQADEDKARLDIKIVDPIFEVWESNCKFTDAPGSKFNTKGGTEKWFDHAFKRMIPSPRDVNIPIDRLHKNTSTLPWNIERFLVPDPPLGSVEMDGEGTVQIIPQEF
ncbi:MAG: hypothetical protein Q7T03_00645 [Deltaproteobacteria bacterium]|nr:hypothetical protein [Deltaproteobacteria bacterium]